MVYCGLFPIEADQFPSLREALDKLQLNDAALRVRYRHPHILFIIILSKIPPFFHFSPPISPLSSMSQRPPVPWDLGSDVGFWDFSTWKLSK